MANRPLIISHKPFHASESGAGLTNTISTHDYFGHSYNSRARILKGSLESGGFSGHHGEQAVNFAISYEGIGIKPIDPLGLKHLDSMLRSVCEQYNVHAFRLWYDQIYSRNENANHMTSQEWVDHGLTPYAFNVVLVLGGEDALERSTRAWVCSEVAAAKLHKGYVYVGGYTGWVEERGGLNTRWNSSAGRREAASIYNRLNSNEIGCHPRDKNGLKQLMLERSGRRQ